MSDPCDETNKYRTELTPVELASLDANNPCRLLERVRVELPESGNVDEARVKVLYPDGRVEDMRNVLRAVISLESSACPQRGPHSKPGTAMAMITLFNNEIGKLQFIVAECALNYQKRPLILTPQ